MTETEFTLNWVTIPNWYNTGLVGFSKPLGLIRARLNNEIMFIGYTTSISGGGLGGRISAYRSPKGTGQKHHAGRQIYGHRDVIEMQIAVLDLPAHEIERGAKSLIRKHEPKWNVPPDRYPH